MMRLVGFSKRQGKPACTAAAAAATREMPEILAAYRMTGDPDYLIHARVADVAD